MTRPTDVPDWATNDTQATGPVVGSPTKVRPSNGDFASGVVPEQQLPAEWFNFLHNAGTELNNWLKNIQLQNFREVGRMIPGGTPAATDLLQNVVRGRRNHIYALSNRAGGGFAEVGGDLGNLQTLPANEIGSAFPDTFNQGVVTWQPFVRSALFDSTGDILVGLGRDTTLGNSAVKRWDFSDSATAYYAGDITDVSLTDYGAPNSENNIQWLAYDSSLDEYYALGFDAANSDQSATWKSTNKGVSWTKQTVIDGIVANDEDCIVSNGKGRLLYMRFGSGANNGSAHVSTDGGATWTLGKSWVTASSEPAASGNAVYSPFYDRFYVMRPLTVAGGIESSLWQSDGDDGFSWTRVFTFHSGSTTPNADDLFTDSGSLIADGPAIVYFHAGRILGSPAQGANPGVVYSSDGGVTWFQIQMGPRETQTAGSTFSVAQSQRVFFDGQAYWILREADATNRAMYMKSLTLGVPAVAIVQPT